MLEGKQSKMTEEGQEHSEGELLNEESKIWKKNAPYLYDSCITHILEWPSLTVQWLPDEIKDDGSKFIRHKMIIGTQTSGEEPNYLMIAQVKLPNETTSTEAEDFKLTERTEGSNVNNNSLNIYIRILHEGEVNKAVFMPQMYNIIATKTNSGQVHIFDFSRHPTKPADDEVKPELRLEGHTKLGFGLNWNEKRAGLLLSGADDHKICLWDINQPKELKTKLAPLHEINYHQKGVNDTKFHRFHPDIFGSASEDMTLGIWDIRQKTDSPCFNVIGHHSEIFSLDFSPFNEHIFLTGSGDNTIGLWDLRNLSSSLHKIDAHKKSVQFGLMSGLEGGMVSLQRSPLCILLRRPKSQCLGSQQNQ